MCVTPPPHTPPFFPRSVAANSPLSDELLPQGDPAEGTKCGSGSWGFRRAPAAAVERSKASCNHHGSRAQMANKVQTRPTRAPPQEDGGRQGLTRGVTRVGEGKVSREGEGRQNLTPPSARGAVSHACPDSVTHVSLAPSSADPALPGGRKGAGGVTRNANIMSTCSLDHPCVACT